MVAARWVARLDRGDLEPEDQACFEAWLSQDDRHFGAFARSKAIWMSAGRLAALPESTSLPPSDRERDTRSPPITRRQVASIVIACSLIALAVPVLYRAEERRPPKQIKTETSAATGSAEIRSVKLADGSTVMLNRASAIVYNLESTQRSVRLVQGEGWFQVAKDRSRPFIVQAGPLKVRALGTAFSVDISPNRSKVTVSEGVVSVGSPEASIQVAAGSQVIFEAGRPPRIEWISDSGIRNLLAWREGRIVLSGETLRSAANRFNQYNRQKIVIASSELANEGVVGSFLLNAPKDFAQSVAISYDVPITTSEDRILLGK